MLLCPGFDRCSRWEALFGAEALREWASVGWRAFEVGRSSAWGGGGSSLWRWLISILTDHSSYIPTQTV